MKFSNTAWLSDYVKIIINQGIYSLTVKASKMRTDFVYLIRTCPLSWFDYLQILTQICYKIDLMIKNKIWIYIYVLIFCILGK